MILAGGQDKLTSAPIEEALASWYRDALEGMKTEREKKLDVQSYGGVRFESVEGAAHHLQNDLLWEKGVALCAEFLDQI